MHGSLFSNVRFFRFVQKRAGYLTLLVLPKRSFDENELKSFKASIQTFFDDDYTVDVNLVDDLPRSKSGKYSYLEQHLKLD